MKLHPFVRMLLWPASFLYGAVVRVRAWLYAKGIVKSKQLDGVVISVGNLTVGGTGKTPMVIWLAHRLLTEGRRVGILTRGYRGSVGQSVGIEAGQDSPPGYVPLHVFSDEVWLYWTKFESKRNEKNLMLGVGRDRWAWGRKLEQAGAEWFLLDDGFQHLRLARDVNIVMLDSTDPFGGGQLLPAGGLREPCSALRRADLVVITRTERAPGLETAVRQHTDAPFFYAWTALTDMPQRNTGSVGPMKADPQRRRFFAFCGIGRPSAFFDDLTRWKIQVAGTMTFPDHYKYSQKDADEIQARAKAAGADALVCTEKDIFNLLQLRFATLPLFYCRIVLHIADAPTFWNQVMEIVKRKRGEAAL